MTTHPTPHDCCPPAAEKPATPERSGLGFGLGAAGAAVIASACCWLPLAFLAMGASAAGVGATFERWRPLMLGVTAVLLAVGFWYAYRPQHCAPGSACATVPPGKRRNLRLSLWIVTVFTAVMAAFPWYAPFLLTPTPPAVIITSDREAAAAHQATYRIDGMTCAACAIHLQRSLAALPGVTAVTVDYDQQRAQVHYLNDDDHSAIDQAVRKATSEEGYRATAASE